MVRGFPHKLRIVVSRRLPQEVEARLSDLCDTTLNADDRPMTAEQLKAAVRNSDVFVPTVTDNLNAQIISAAGPDLRLIANFGAGTDHIDVEAAYAKDIIVTNTPDVLTEDTADLAMVLILAVPRRLVEGDRLARAGKFTGWAPTGHLGRRVRGMKLGIIGMGRIGQAVARRASAFGLSVHYHGRQVLPDPVEVALGATYHVNLDEMLEHVDIVSVNCPSTPHTRHLIDARRLERIGPDGYIVNTSRGDVIDEAALARALSEGIIAGAGLDVYEHEPTIHPDLITLTNVVLAPHIGSSTSESRREMGETVLINIRTWINGRRPPDRVLPPGALYSRAS